MPETAAYCPACGRPVVHEKAENAGQAQGTVGIFPERVAAGLAYLSFLPAIVFLMLTPYKENRFLRFHSVQCLLLWLVCVGTAAAIRAIMLIMVLIPIIGPLIAVLVPVITGIAVFVLWLVLVVKALQGEWFKLPVLGDLAERYSNGN